MRENGPEQALSWRTAQDGLRVELDPDRAPIGGRHGHDDAVRGVGGWAPSCRHALHRQTVVAANDERLGHAVEGPGSVVRDGGRMAMNGGAAADVATVGNRKDLVAKADTKDGPRRRTPPRQGQQRRSVLGMARARTEHGKVRVGQFVGQGIDVGHPDVGAGAGERRDEIVGEAVAALDEPNAHGP